MKLRTLIENHAARNEEKARQDEKKKQKQQIKKLTFDMEDEEEEEEDDDDEAGPVDIKKDPDEPEPSTSVRSMLSNYTSRITFISLLVTPSLTITELFMPNLMLHFGILSCHLFPNCLSLFPEGDRDH